MLAGISESVTFDARIFFKVVLFKTLPKIPACMDFALLSAESFVISSTFSKLMSLISAPDTDRKDRGADTADILYRMSVTV